MKLKRPKGAKVITSFDSIATVAPVSENIIGSEYANPEEAVVDKQRGIYG